MHLYGAIAAHADTSVLIRRGPSSQFRASRAVHDAARVNKATVVGAIDYTFDAASIARGVRMFVDAEVRG